MTVIIGDDAFVVIKKEALVLFIGVIAEDLKCVLGGAGTVLTRESEGCCMTIVPGAEVVLHLVVIKVLIHWDGPDILAGILVVYLEIIGIDWL